jgi:Phosphate-induced protein 1 conserved region
MQLVTFFLASLVSANIFARTVDQALAIEYDKAGRNDIKYIPGRRVLTEDVNIYHIYYGDWTTAQKDLIDGFANGIGESSWYTTTKQYYSQSSATANKRFINGKVRLAFSVTDTGSFGTSLSGNDLPDIIDKFISAGTLPNDPNGVYFVLTSGEISESIRPDLGTASFCSDYCGYQYIYSS